MTAHRDSAPRAWQRTRGRILLRMAPLRVPHPVWGLNGVIAAGALLLVTGPVARLAPLARPHIAWWVIVPVFAMAELCVVHLHFRRGAHSFSLGEIPLVFGLVFCTGRGVVVACVLGSAIVLITSRKLPPVKLVFNLAQFTVATCLAAIVTHGLAPVGAPLDPRTWLAVIAATQCAGVATVLLIAAAISLSERQMRIATIARMVAADGAVTLNNSSLGLCGVVMLAIAPAALVLLVVPLGTLFVAYRAYLSELERQKQLEFVHEANRTLTGTGEMVRVLAMLLERSLQVFRAESAEIVLFGQAAAPAQRLLRGPPDHPEEWAALDAETADALHEMVREPFGARTLGPGLGAPHVADRLGHRDVTRAMIAPLTGEEGLIGAILVAHRPRVGDSFGRDDLRLLETLAHNASVALQNDRLEQAVAQLTVAHDDLHHVANHDALTGLVNRRAFIESLRAALGEDPLAVGLLFVDVDNFKAVNDTLGHASGDEVLVTVAARLRACLRGDDVVARLAGDEFAVMVRAPGIVEAAAVSVAQRIIRTCRIEVADADGCIAVHASVGIAVCRRPEMTAEELVHAADMAMYNAKTGGKGRFEILESHPSSHPQQQHGG